MSIYHPTISRKRADGTTYRTKARTWVGEYIDPASKRRIRVSLRTRDKTAAKILLAEIQRKSNMRYSATPSEKRADSLEVHADRSIEGHIDDWEASLFSEASERHAKDSARMVRAMMNGAGVKTWRDMDQPRVERWLADHKKAAAAADSTNVEAKRYRNKGVLNTSTRNHYLRAAKMFTRWMFRVRRAAEDPLFEVRISKKAADADKRHERRAFTDDELAKLMDAAESGPVRFGIPGTDRAMVYRFAAATGLRSGECRGLTRFAFDLEAGAVTIAASLSKNSETVTLPLRASLVALLRAYVADKAGPVFPMPSPCNVVRMLRDDMTAAGINYRDSLGRVADFHSLRHSFCTRLASAGVHPKRMKELARHSSIELTMNFYTHTSRAELASALEATPELPTVKKAAAAAG